MHFTIYFSELSLTKPETTQIPHVPHGLHTPGRSRSRRPPFCFVSTFDRLDRRLNRTPSMVLPPLGSAAAVCAETIQANSRAPCARAGRARGRRREKKGQIDPVFRKALPCHLTDSHSIKRRQARACSRRTQPDSRCPLQLSPPSSHAHAPPPPRPQNIDRNTRRKNFFD
jgi:hypothetical protein